MWPQAFAGGSFPVLSSRACSPSIRGPDGSEACHMATSPNDGHVERAHSRPALPAGDVSLHHPWSGRREGAPLKARGKRPDICLWTLSPSDTPTTSSVGRLAAATRNTTGGPSSWPPWLSRRWSARGPTRRPTAPWSSSPRRQPLPRPTRPAPPSPRRRPRLLRSPDQTSDGRGTAACHGRNVSTKREPPSSSTGDSAWTVPPMAVASSATIARPSPEPI
jgi:hypothetical protein